MNAWLSARRIKAGHEDEFRKKWRGGATPDGMVDAFLLEDEEDPRETLSISLWDSAEKLLSYRTGDEAKKREQTLNEVVDKDRWSRSFVGWNTWDLDTPGGKKKWFMLPLLLAAGAGAYFFLKRRNAGKDDEWDAWEPDEASAMPTDPTFATAGTPTGSRSYTPPSTFSAADEGRNGGSQPTITSTARIESGSVSTGPGAGPGVRSVEVTTPRPAGGARTPATGRAGGVVRDFMTAQPTTVTVSDDVASAARVMRDLDVGSLPVLADGRLAGIVTDRDLALAVGDRDHKPSAIMVGDVMTEAPTTVNPNTSIEEAAKLMGDRQVRRLPVVDGARLVGMLALGDIAADGAERAAASALEDISEPSTPHN